MLIITKLHKITHLNGCGCAVNFRRVPTTYHKYIYIVYFLKLPKLQNEVAQFQFFSFSKIFLFAL